MKLTQEYYQESSKKYEMNMSRKRKSPKQGTTRAEDITIILPEGHDSPTIDQTKLTNLTYGP